MGGEGSMKAMSTILKNNRKLIKSKRLFSKKRTFGHLRDQYKKAAGDKINFKHSTEEDLQKIRQKIRKQKRKEQLLFLSIFIFVIALFSYFSYGFIQQNRLVVERQHQLQLEKKEQRYINLIKDGDRWFKKSKWHNSIFYYEKAIKLFPHDYNINYRLVNAYSLQCAHEFTNCLRAKMLLDSLLKNHPEHQDSLMVIKSRLEYEY